MDTNVYHRLYRELNKPEDIPRVSKKYTLQEDMILVIYTQKAIREVIKKFYRIKGRSARLYRQWTRGTPLLDISHANYFSPVLTAKLVLEHHGIGRKTFNSYVRDQSLIENPRLRKEIKDIVDNDIIYSPEGDRVQRERGIMGEKEIADWLDEMGAEYLRENDLREMGEGKTPDFKLKRPLVYRDMELNWVESKASFGDKWKLNEDYKNQLKPYRKLFGPGMVIYWYGFVTPYHEEKDIVVANRSILIDYANVWVKKDVGNE